MTVSNELMAEVAHAVVAEVNETFGEEAASKLQSYKLIQHMARGYITGHAAITTRKILAELPEHQAPVPVTWVDIGLEQEYPCILYSSYLRALAERNRMDVLTQGVDLEAFWGKMQPLLPKHPIFELPASARAYTIPLFLIGDEGRGYKKSAVFVLGAEPVLGTGCDAEDTQTSQDDMKMNFRGNTTLTRQLFACIPKTVYADNAEPLHKLVNIWADDFANLFNNGLDIRSGGCTQTWRIAVLGLKADWPALVEYAICVWPIHSNVLLGTNVTLWDFRVTGCDARGLDKNLAHLYKEMKAFSADRNLYLHMNNLTKGLVGISSAADFPVGTWFKGADTTFVLKFLVFKFETVLASEVLQGHDRLYFAAILDCLQASDAFLSLLYKAGLFLEKRRLARVVRHGLAMVSGYSRCAALANDRSLARFKLTPKYHMLMHIVHQLQVDKDRGRSPLNPLSYSCQMPEDFINRIATLCRSVSPRFVGERGLDLYKIALAKVW
ncbi:unnamed protein product [Symbiodinium sp. CCMP2456]|nr:unnamed protein product [Symbiodinium sp. CCMP2456]